MDLESKLDQISSENRALQDSISKAEHQAQLASQQIDVHAQSIRQATDEVRARDLQLSEKDADIAQAKTLLAAMQQELARLKQENEQFGESHRSFEADAEGKFAALEVEHAKTHQSWQESTRELDDLRNEHEQLRNQHAELSSGLEEVVRQEIANALADRNEEIRRLNEELESAMGQIKMLQQQILESKQGETFLSVRDEDYFDSACQQLCQHVQQWVLRFSKVSDKLNEREKLEDRLDSAVLDGTDVDLLLADRIKRRDVFMSLVMSMLWEHIFTRYLFGMDREQRQKLKTLEKTLTEVGPRRAVAQWRAITLTLLSKRPQFQSQRADDTEAVMWAIYTTLATLLPPEAKEQPRLQDSLRNIIRLAVDLAIEMRTQRAEYIMMPPLQPEYDTNGDLVQKVHFNASLMNERSGDTTSNEELEQRGAVVKILLFPLVVKKGDDLGEGEDEIVICPAQVLVAKPRSDKKVVRVLSGAMEIDPRKSTQSILPPESVAMSGI
ncbi:hypothetical protein NA57DRAFT_64844 [Rhizodiscina lignyota]|uniref:Uncharacterized protein n=1 Tax=Rhizodiscina lignyota TaxID=1504668 RepID=A0A9P4IN93_9PEZI|nr:hypothetical protein NA57DRAFT_64844 [Rhizodiscina lignyota]